MSQTARSKRRAERALAEGRTPGRPGPAKKRNEADQKAVIRERNAAYRAANREKLRQQRLEDYAAFRSGMVEPKKRGRHRKYGTPEEYREADREKARRWREANYEQCLATNRVASKKRKAARALAEGRVPGLVGNPKRCSPEERVVGKEARRARWAARKGQELIRQMWIAARHRRRVRIKQVGGSYTLEDVVYLFELQKGKCTFCLKPLEKGRFHIDHHVPLARGGANDRSNLRLLHKQCNLDKGASDPVAHALKHGLLCW